MAAARIGAKLTLDQQNFSQGLRSAESETKRFVAGMKDQSRILSSSIGGGFGRGFTELHSAISLASLSLKGFSSLASRDLGVENLVRSLGAVTTDVETLDQQLQALRKVAESPGLTMQEAIAGSTALQRMGMTARESRDALLQLGNALAASGKGSADLAAVMESLEQMKSAGTIDDGNIKEISRRISGFRQMVAGLNREDPMAFIRGAVKELQKLPRVLSGAQESSEGFFDELDAFMLKKSGARFSGIKANIMEAGKEALKGDWHMAGERISNAGRIGFGDLEPENPLSKYQPSEAEIERRKKAQIAAEKAVKDARLGHMREVLDKERELSKMEGYADEARALDETRSGTQQQLIAMRSWFNLTEEQARTFKDLADHLERQAAVMREAPKLAKALNVEESQVHDWILKQVQLQQQLRDKIKDVQGEPGRQRAMEDREVRKLRAAGKGRAADKLEADLTEKRTREGYIQQGYDPKTAEDLAKEDRQLTEDEQHFQRTGRRLIRTRKAKPRGNTNFNEEGGVFDPQASDVLNVVNRQQRMEKEGTFTQRKKDAAGQDIKAAPLTEAQMANAMKQALEQTFNPIASLLKQLLPTTSSRQSGS